MTGFRHRYVTIMMLSLTMWMGLLATLSIAPAAAQDAACPLAPVPLPLFDATPAAVIAATPAGSDEAPEPTEDELVSVIEGLITCTNDASQAVRYAVFTDRYVASLFTAGGTADQPAFERMIATGQMPEAGSSTLEAVSDIEPLPDGRIGLTMRISTPTGIVEDRVILAWNAEEGAWLIDEVVSLDPPPTPYG